MILYHGTTATRLPKILRSGIRGAGTRNVKGNWEGDVKAKTGFVYLTDVYSVYFAYTASDDSEDLAIVEVDADEDILYPDEDFLAWNFHRQDDSLSLVEWTKILDPRDYAEHWRLSLRGMGRVASEPVEACRITRHIVFPQDHRILALGADTVPMPIGYTMMKDLYRETTRLLFEQGVDAAFDYSQNYRKRLVPAMDI